MMDSTDVQHPARRAYDFLEAIEEDGYEHVVLETMARGGCSIHTPDYCAFFIIEEGVAYVLFALGDLRKLLSFACTNAALLGFDRVAWRRSLVGKHEGLHSYSVEQLGVHLHLFHS